MSLSVSDVFSIAAGERLLVPRPLSLATDWSWQIREKDNPAIVKDFSALISNATRHQLVEMDSRYEVDVKYQVRVFDDTNAVVDTMDFWIERASFGTASVPDFTEFNTNLRLALGLAGLDSRWDFSNYDAATGIPLRGVLTVYTDKTLSVVLAKYVLTRRLNAARQVVGEVQRQTYFDPDALFGTGTGTGTGSGSGSA
jgi:hypothetical protein